MNGASTTFRNNLIIRNTAIMMAMISVSLIIGMVGYRITGGFSWMDSFLNAAMILTGMGPVHDPDSSLGKLFSGCFALYSGIIFLSAVAIFIFPILQQFNERFDQSGKNVSNEEK